MQSTTGAKCRKDAVGAHAGLSPDNSEDHLDQGIIWNVRGTRNDALSLSAPPPRSVRRVEPGPPNTNRDSQWHRQIHGATHRVGDDLTHPLFLPRSDLEDELVVDLQQHTGTKPVLSKSLIGGEHGQLHEVGSCALDRRVEGSTFRHLATLPIRRVEIG